MTVPTAKTKRSLLDYNKETAMAKAMARCKVCQLPPEIRVQIKEAREKEVRAAVIVDWLKDEYNKELASSDFATHANGRHPNG